MARIPVSRAAVSACFGLATASAGLFWASSALAAADAGPGEPSPTGRIAGRVLDEHGQPVAGAVMQLYDRGGVRPPRAGKSGLDGTYEFSKLPHGWSYVVAAEFSGYARAFCQTPVEAGQQLNLDIALRKPVRAVIKLRDEAGKPLAGARLRSLNQRGLNGQFRLQAGAEWKLFDVRFEPSDAEGRLTLPPVPDGTTIDASIVHPQAAPIAMKNLLIHPHAELAAVMHPGVMLTFRVIPGESKERVSELEIDLRHEVFQNPSTTFDQVPFDSQGTAHLTVEPGNYEFFWFKHSDYLVTPWYTPDRRAGRHLTFARGKKYEFLFELHRKVLARGRVINEVTGKPVVDAMIGAEIPNTVPPGGITDGADPWMHADWADTDAKGQYRVTVAAGPARVRFSERNFQAKRDHFEFQTAADGSTVIPDIRVDPSPKVIGTVVGPDGQPAANTIVRFRGEHLRWVMPTLTDAKGRFELQVPFIPLDDHDKRVTVHPLVAFHAYAPLGARVDVHLDKPESLAKVTIRLRPQPYENALAEIDGDLGKWEKRDTSDSRVRELAHPEMRGRAAPPLDCKMWLNVPGQKASLADFRGRCVLLDFWTTWCGPCRGDYPSVKMAYELYKDHGLAVIGVHDNSVAPDSIRKHVETEKMPFPIAIDRPDGATLTAYKAFGVTGYPSYLLLGPQGEIVYSDSQLPGPTLRGFKLELIRARLMAADSVASHRR